MSQSVVHIALLRAVNVAGSNRVAMADLRQLLARLGFEEVRSVLQSGNLVFRGGERPTGRLEDILEEAAKEGLGLETDFFVRTADEWKTVIANNPFPSEAERDPSHLVVMFLKAAPDPDDVAAVREAIPGRETVRVDGRHAYIVYPDGIGRSRLTNAWLEGKFGTRGTGRNWNTVLKLGALAET